MSIENYDTTIQALKEAISKRSSDLGTTLSDRELEAIEDGSKPKDIQIRVLSNLFKNLMARETFQEKADREGSPISTLKDSLGMSDQNFQKYFPTITVTPEEAPDGSEV